MKKLLTVLLLCSFAAKAEFVIPNLAYTGTKAFGKVESNLRPYAVIQLSSYLSPTPNSLANQTAAFMNAVNAAAAAGGTSNNPVILLTPSNYSVYTKTITLPSNITVQGSPGFVHHPYTSDGELDARLYLIKNVQYVTLTGFEIDMDMARGDLHFGWSSMEIAEAAHHVVIQNMYIHHDPRNMSLPQDFNTNTYGYIGIVIGGGHDIEIRNNRIEDTDTQVRAFESGTQPLYNLYIHHNVFRRGTSEGVGVGSVSHPTSFTTNITVQYNWIEGKHESWGMAIEGVETFDVSWNNVFDCLEGMTLSSGANVGTFIYPQTGQVVYRLPSKYGTIKGNRFYGNTIAGLRVSGQDILVDGNHFGSNHSTGIDTERQSGVPTSNYTSSNLRIVNNVIDSIISEFGSPMILKYIASSLIANNLLKNNKNNAQMSFRYYQPYGTGNNIRYNVSDRPFYFEDNDFSGSNTFVSNKFPSYASGSIPNNAWTNTGNTSNADYSQPSGILAGQYLLLYNQTASPSTYPLVGNWKTPAGSTLTTNTVLQPNAGIVLYKSSIQPIIEMQPDPIPGAPLKIKRPINVQFQ